MAGRGPAPKPAHLRQRRNRKAGRAELEATATAAATLPELPNPDERVWHPLTLVAWEHAWASPMATQWLETDVDALGRVALLWDQFYQHQDPRVLAEIRLQEQRFGSSPLDRSRLQWEFKRGQEADRHEPQRAAPQRSAVDPRAFLLRIK